MNVLDLVIWRNNNVRGICHYWNERDADHTLWKLGSSPPGLLAFYCLVEAVDPSWGWATRWWILLLSRKGQYCITIEI
uniref:Hexosyltransferase n=1 Tax=Arundo donax TaxID=35708 RepID=A0A0A8Z7D0_ARUDO